MSTSTIFALSSGSAPSGVAIIRVSGENVRFALETMLGNVPEPRKALLADIRNIKDGGLLDRGIVIYFPAPNSFTGEDCCEFQVHGGLAVINAVLDNLGALKDFRHAEPGEFSKRAFENGKLDLLEVEGLADLIASQTEKQRRQAVGQSGGELSELYEKWRARLIRSRALIEATLDFSDQEDVSDDAGSAVKDEIASIVGEVERHLDDQNRGEIVREGYRVVLLGPPNAGKSSLLNALAKRDVAIVSAIAGTTRDIIEVNLDLGGFKVIISDTAGIREKADEIENMGIEKARKEALAANLVIWLSPGDAPVPVPDFLQDNGAPEVLKILSKSDLCSSGEMEEMGVSVKTSNGLDSLIKTLTIGIGGSGDVEHSLLLSRKRHRLLLASMVSALKESLTMKDEELISENMRFSGDQLGRITGKIDVEELYDVIFSEFCIGK